MTNETPQASMPFLEKSIAELGKMLRNGEVSSRALVEESLERIRTHDGALHSFVSVTEDLARARAKKADEELASGIDRGPLHGIPYALKDNVDTAGILSTSCSKVYADRIPKEDATVAAKLEQAGGILVGKTTLFEFALGGPWDMAWPPARNPWNLDHLPGGSSSGSAAAVAAGLVLGAIGTDTGGSIRWPAAVCGLTGLKPTYGRISRFGIHSDTFSLDTAGPITRTVEDCAIMLGALAGFDHKDIGSVDCPVPDFQAALDGDVQGLKIGLVRNWYVDDADPEVTAAVDAAAQKLRDLGAIVEEVELDSLQDFTDVKWTISLAELWAIHEADMKNRPQDFSKSFRQRVWAGALVRAEDYVQAQRWRTELLTRTMAHFRRYDALLTAGWFTTAERADPNGHDFFKTRFYVTQGFSVTGTPSICIPCGFSSSGLPLSAQISGKPFDEATVLKIADAYQRVTHWHHERPNLN